MAGKPSFIILALVLVSWGGGQSAAAQVAHAIPRTETYTLTGQKLSLPSDLRERATILILGFGRHSQDATTAWERPVRLQLARLNLIQFYDMAMIAEVPSIMRSWVIRAIKHKVPEVVQPNFVPLTDDETEWKQAAGYSDGQSEAAYVMLVDRAGHIVWSTHEPFSPGLFAELRQRSELLVR